MALANILDSIRKEAAEQAKEIKNSGQEKIAVQQKELALRLKKEKGLLLRQAENEARKKVDQAKFKGENEEKAAELDFKQTLLGEIFKQAAQRLSTRSEYEQVKLLRRLLDKLPADKEGKIIATKNSAALLKKAWEKSSRSFPLAAENAEGTGGFIFVSPKMEIDNRYESLIANLRQDLETEVAKILFS